MKEKQLITILKENGDMGLTQQALSQVPQQALRSLLDKADSAYYRPGLTAILSDEEYDKLRNFFKSKWPNDPTSTRVGPSYDPNEIGNKVQHSIPMGSLDNTDDGVVGYGPWLEWLKEKTGGSNPPIILASLKIDGGSICASYKEGKLVRVATRGNGEYGEDITANAVNFHWLPSELPLAVDVEIRGEAILYRKDFDTICASIPKEDQSNPRNVGNGILGRHDGKDSNYIRFFAFNLHNQDGMVAFETEAEKFAKLTQLGFTPVVSMLCPTLVEFQQFYDNILESRDKLPFDIDGIVVVVNDLKLQEQFVTNDIRTKLRPKYARAVKFGVKTAVTELVGLNVTVGHTGALIPTGILKKVRIGGVYVSNVLLNNWDEIKRLDLAIGDQVTICLSGEIIPKCLGNNRETESEGVSERQALLEPTNCPVCSSVTTRMHRGKSGAITYCSNSRCPAAVFAKLDHWIGTSKKGVGILDIGDNMIKALWEANLLADPADLYTLTPNIQDIVLESGGKIGKSRAEKIIANINAKRHLPLPVFLGALGIDLLGRRRAELLRNAAGGQLDRLEDWLDIEKLKTINVAGFGDIIRNSVVNGIEENKDLIQKLLKNGVTVGDNVRIEPIVEANGDHKNPVKPFTGLEFCWTGTRELLREVEEAGGIIKSGISKGLHYLVQKDPLSQSNKTLKAESYGTKIIGVEHLRDVLAGKAEL